MGITLSHFINQFPPTRFPLLTAIRMSHFLPVHHLGIAFFGPGRRSKHNKMKKWRNSMLKVCESRLFYIHIYIFSMTFFHGNFCFTHGTIGYQSVWPILPVRFRVELGVMAMKTYSKLPRYLQLATHKQIQFSAMNRHPIFWRVFPSEDDKIKSF